MKTELKKIKALIDSQEELIDGSRVYADIDVWSEAKEAYESLVKESDSLPCVSDRSDWKIILHSPLKGGWMKFSAPKYDLIDGDGNVRYRGARGMCKWILENGH